MTNDPIDAGLHHKHITVDALPAAWAWGARATEAASG
jgi:hypothetical protein